MWGVFIKIFNVYFNHAYLYIKINLEIILSSYDSRLYEYTKTIFKLICLIYLIWFFYIIKITGALFNPLQKLELSSFQEYLKTKKTQVFIFYQESAIFMILSYDLLNYISKNNIFNIQCVRHRIFVNIIKTYPLKHCGSPMRTRLSVLVML